MQRQALIISILLCLRVLFRMTAKSRRGSLFLYFRTMHAISRARTPARAALRGRSRPPVVSRPAHDGRLAALSDAHGGDQYRLYARCTRPTAMSCSSPSRRSASTLCAVPPRGHTGCHPRRGPPAARSRAGSPWFTRYQEHAPNGLNLGRIDGPDWKSADVDGPPHDASEGELSRSSPTLSASVGLLGAPSAHAREVDSTFPS